MRGQTFCLCMRVCVCIHLLDSYDTFPLCLHQTSKRHLHPALTLNSIYSVLWEFMASAPHNGPPDCTALSKTHSKHSLKALLTSAPFNCQRRASVKLCMSRKPLSAARFTAKTTVSLVFNLLQNPCPVKDASFLSKILFWWFTG